VYPVISATQDSAVQADAVMTALRTTRHDATALSAPDAE
jgi:hypothetical protein